MHKIKTSIIWTNVMVEKRIVAVSSPHPFSILTNRNAKICARACREHFPNIVWFPFDKPRTEIHLFHRCVCVWALGILFEGNVQSLNRFNNDSSGNWMLTTYRKTREMWSRSKRAGDCIFSSRSSNSTKEEKKIMRSIGWHLLFCHSLQAMLANGFSVFDNVQISNRG